MNIAYQEHPNDGTTMRIIARELPDSVAGLAIDIAKHCSMVSAIEDGEDKAGRQKLRLHQPKEVAARACEIAHHLWREFRERNWLLDVPEPKPPQAFTPEEREAMLANRRALRRTPTPSPTDATQKP